MRVVRLENIIDLLKLRPVVREWRERCNANTMGVKTDEEHFFDGLLQLVQKDDCDLFTLRTGALDTVVGFMGMTVFNSPLGDQRIAIEHYWYVMEEYRDRGSMGLMNAAQEWARKHKCSHLVMNASTLASDMHDKVCKYYERLGMRKFETSYIQEIT